MNDLERKRAEIEQRESQEMVDRVADAARDVLNGMDRSIPHEVITALLLAVLAAADQLDIERGMVVECLTKMAKTVKTKVTNG